MTVQQLHKPLRAKQRIIRGQVMTVQVRYNKCGKNCSKCQAGERHGPYLYGTFRGEDGKQHSHYIGKVLPEGVTP